MSNYTDVHYVTTVEGQRHKEWIKEAEQMRLIKASWSQRPRGQWGVGTVAARLSIRLAEWGARLYCTARASVARIASG